MTQKEKKRKAAAIAIATYVSLINNNKEEEKTQNWKTVSRALRMQRQGLLRFSGRIPTHYKLRM